MAFTRKFLIDNGVPEDKIDIIMAERNRTLADYVPKADVQAQIDEALKAHKPNPIDPTTTDEYRQLAQERDMLRTINGDDFQRVKPKFREQVFGMLDRSDKAKPIPEQLKSIREKYEEYYIAPAQTEEPPAKPQFGAPTQGSMPSGRSGDVAAFRSAWGYSNKKE